MLVINWKPQQLKYSEEVGEQAADVDSMIKDRFPLFDPSLIKTFRLLL
jgi:hypothetical protein